MPNTTDKALFCLGLMSYLAGQIWIVTSGSMTKAEIAFDAIHWLMFIGASLMIPFAARLPRTGLAVLAGPLLLAGCILIIGMCMIDFVLWSFPEPELRNAVIAELMDTPSVWTPFIWLAGRVFTVALALLGVCFWSDSKVGSTLTVIGAVITSAWGIGSNPYGYAVMLIGFALCFFGRKSRA